MRYGQGGGFTAQERARRERVRLEAVDRFGRGETNGQVAAGLRVGRRQVEKWRRAWREGGAEALLSRGPMTRPRLDAAQFAVLEAELGRGPAAHGWEVDQRWTLARVAELIQRLFGVSYSLPGVSKLLRRNGWSCQQPVRRAMERDEEAIEVWKKEVWGRVERPRPRPAPGSVSRTRPGKD